MGTSQKVGYGRLRLGFWDVGFWKARVYALGFLCGGGGEAWGLQEFFGYLGFSVHSGAQGNTFA